MATTNTTAREHAVITSEDVEGATVYDGHGKKIGKINHLIIERLSGRIVSVVVNVSGFLGLGHSHVELPWTALRYDTRLNGFEAQTRASPSST